jgi:hypothetical protein
MVNTLHPSKTNEGYHCMVWHQQAKHFGIFFLGGETGRPGLRIPKISVSQGKLKYELLDPAPSLQDIHILHRGGAQITTGHFVQ